MTTQAYFENIQQQIKKELLQATQSIIVVVAWFTDNELYEILCNKLKDGLSVSVLISNDPINTSPSGLNFNIIKEFGGEFILLEGNRRDKMMHNKFCIIDNDTVITGSYNWTRRAQSNDENIVVTKGSRELANEFLITFFELKKKQGGKTEFEFDLTQVCKRLEILKSTITIQDEDDIVYQLSRLKKLLDFSLNFPNLNTLFDIIQSIESKEYGKTISLIDAFLKEFRSLIIYVDPELAGLKLEIKSLEIQVSSLQDEKSDMERKIYAFEIKHNYELGDLIKRILNLRKKIAEKKLRENPDDEEKKKEFEEAENDYDKYKKNIDSTKDEKIIVLNNDQQNELKIKFRRASKLCHPDVVADTFKLEAEKIFIELQNAYSKNDLETVNSILDYLENGKPFKAKHETITAKDLIKKESIRLRRLLLELLKEINEIKASETFKIISSISDIENYFAQTKTKLSVELDLLTQEYENEKSRKQK